MTTHAVYAFNTKPKVSLVVAECGAVATVMEDGSTVPKDFEFYLPPDLHKATCWRCREKLYEAKQRGKRKRERAAR